VRSATNNELFTVAIQVVDMICKRQYLDLQASNRIVNETVHTLMLPDSLSLLALIVIVLVDLVILIGNEATLVGARKVAAGK